MSLRARLTAPLTPDQAARWRLRLALIPVYGWIAWVCWSFALDMSTSGTIDRSGHIKGHDFAHFYMLGQIGNERATTDLYSFDAQSARLDRLVPQYEDRFLPVHPPQVALFFAPLARLPYLAALTTWLCLSALIFAWVCRALWKSSAAVRTLGRWHVVALCAGYPAVQAAIASGQTSTLALGWITLGWLALRRHRPFLAGLALGSLIYKPSLGVVFAFAFFFAGNVPLIAGALLASSVQILLAATWFGWSALVAFVENAGGLGGRIHLLEAQPWQMHSLRSFFSLLIPSTRLAWIAYAVSAAGVTALAVWAWRCRGDLRVRFAVLLCATMLVDPHVYSYELVILTCAFFLAGDWWLERERSRTSVLVLLSLAYWLPAFDSLTRYTHFQVSVPVLVMLTVRLAIEARRPVAELSV